uniref:Sushi, nidogen and EGF-like domain-containing protein 1 n=1 Tax=Magallana gigas TaxID=29159 RepID=K1PT21_MAGGI
MLSIKVFGYPLSQFYPFGLTAGDSSLPGNDDGSTSSILISVPFPFFGPSYRFIFVNNNGDVTFDTELTQYTAQAFPINGSHKMIAAFWTDIDTDPGGSLWYRTSTDSSILQLGTNIIRTTFPSFVTFSATWMMVVTWEEVAAYGCSNTSIITCQQRNTFQLVLITNGVYSFVVFNYNKITWAKSTQVGINAGDGINYYSVPGSMKDSMLNLTQMSNVGVPGQFVFRVDVRVNPDIDECLPDPCHNNGTCTDLVNNYQCNCAAGFNGTNCENNIDECAAQPCQNHGNCVDLINNYQCHCTDGFNGTHCLNNIDDCVPDPCQNNGTCTDLVNDYQCYCVAGFNGTNCDFNIDECASQPCQNNGTCEDLINDYQCRCKDGFNGTTCLNNIDDCIPVPCQNNGTCTDLVNDYNCDCVLGFYGIDCENNIDDCESQPCQNNGTCTDMINDYLCHCTVGFNGRNCSNSKSGYDFLL